MHIDLFLGNIKQYHIKKKTAPMITYLSSGMGNVFNKGPKWQINIKYWLKNNLNHEVIDSFLDYQFITKEDLSSWILSSYSNIYNSFDAFKISLSSKYKLEK
tara:strand:+ start:781 stop:1086 length:306 start_codon:yes stop_codon:yes gene_type:complete